MTWLLTQLSTACKTFKSVQSGVKKAPTHIEYIQKAELS